MTAVPEFWASFGRSADRVHASEREYKSWLDEHVVHRTLRWQKMVVYRRFVGSFPDLAEWYDAPLDRRLGFTGGPRYAKGRSKAHEAIGYLAYLSFVKGISLTTSACSPAIHAASE